MTNNKKLYGQFFTTINPFNIDIFYKWFDLIPENKKKILLEPFAGSNNIVKMIQDLKFTYEWHCYDINPGKNCVPEFQIEKRDTLKDFPSGYHVILSNPPYLAKNSATKTKLDFPKTQYDDLYKYAMKQFIEYEKLEGINNWKEYDFSIDCSNDQMKFKDMLQIRCIEELTEATHAMDNKEHFFEEMTDATNFFLSAYCMLGIDFKDFDDEAILNEITVSSTSSQYGEQALKLILAFGVPASLLL